MKKLLIPFLLLAILLGAGLWFLLRRGPAGAPPPESGESFQIHPQEPGTLIQYADGQTPLRAIRWLPPLPKGLLAVQILTQSDRQRVALFSPEGQIASLLIPKPAGVREGFFNFAELRDAVVVPGDVAVFLYRAADPTSGELPLILAVDLTSQGLRWVHRAPAERLAAAGSGKDGAVFLFGTDSPVLRIPLALRKGEALGSTPFRVTLKPMEMPSEVRSPADLLPTGPWSFLLCHQGGLSSFSESKGWQHWPVPGDAPLAFPASRPVLAHGKHYWWQPFPGCLIKVGADGAELDSLGASELAPPEPWKRDGSLLVLRGADPSGNLWFTLAAPLTPPTLATPAPERTPSAETAEPGEKAASEAPASAASQETWAAYCAQGLDRIYGWNPERRTFRMRSLPELWVGLSMPAGLNRPAALKELRPESGRLLLDFGPSAWSLPLERILEEPRGTDRKAQVR